MHSETCAHYALCALSTYGRSDAWECLVTIGLVCE